MKHTIVIIVFVIFLIPICQYVYSQAPNILIKNGSKPDSLKSQAINIPDTSQPNDASKGEFQEQDLTDVIHNIFKPHGSLPGEHGQTRDTYRHFSFIPAAGYTLQTGWAGVFSSNMAYFNDTLKDSKLSSISASITYSQYRQTIIPFQANIWTKGNDYNFITEVRFIKYPSSIYGLGGRTDPNKGVTINFSSIKIHQTVMREVSENVYLGLGYFYDRFWQIKALDNVSRMVNNQIAKELGKTETASGPVFRFLYDTRLNQINPQQGALYAITYRSNSKSLGSDSSSEDLKIDARTYLHFPSKSKNVLAFWMLDWLTVSGTPPYLLLPSTGWDDNYNTGRGYIQGRLRGRKMLYFESEYRFGISRNGLLGGVVFTNMQNFSSDLSREYSNVFIGYGMGVRIKLNKSSRTNLAIDYGFGKNGSQGFFVNLGEVF